jgi:hypothetical protein
VAFEEIRLALKSELQMEILPKVLRPALLELMDRGTIEMKEIWGLDYYVLK